eukprot:2816824-Ditylum_brightwellii.AAC.1
MKQGPAQLSSPLSQSLSGGPSCSTVKCTRLATVLRHLCCILGSRKILCGGGAPSGRPLFFRRHR